MITPKTKSTLTTNSVEVLTIIGMLLPTMRSLIGLTKNRRHGVPSCSSVSPLAVGSRVVYPERRFKAVGVSTAVPGRKSVLVKPKQLPKVAGDDEGSPPTT